MKKLVLSLGLCFLSINSVYSLSFSNHPFEKKTTIKKEISKKININEDSKKTLSRLKGVGNKRAKQILEYKKSNGEFHSDKDFLKINTINKKTLQKIISENKDLIIYK